MIDIEVKDRYRWEVYIYRWEGYIYRRDEYLERICFLKDTPRSE